MEKTIDNWKIVKNIFFIFGILIIFGIIFAIMLLIKSKWYAFILLILVCVSLIIIRKTPVWKKWYPIIIWFLAISISIMILVFTRPDKTVSFQGTVVRELIRLIFVYGDAPLFQPEQKEHNWQEPEDYTNTIHILTNPDSSIELLKRKDSNDKKIIYMLHGGAYINDLADYYHNLAVNYSKISAGADVALLDYRTASQAIYPAALEDAYEGYIFLIKQGYKPEDIILIGDSAGGNLALSLTMKLRNENKSIPSGMILISPWADITASGSSHKENIYKDPLFGVKKGELPKEEPIPLNYFKNCDLENVYVSPALGTYENFPPILIQVGTWEILHSDSIMVYENAKSSNIDVKLSEYQGMFHTFPTIFGPIFPEAKIAWNEMEQFIDDIWNIK